MSNFSSDVILDYTYVTLKSNDLWVITRRDNGKGQVSQILAGKGTVIELNEKLKQKF